MHILRTVAAAAILLLCGSAAEKPNAPPPPEPMRFVQLSLKHRYESPVVSFKVERRFLPVSAVENYRAAHAAPDVVIDVCEYMMNGTVVTLTACVQY